jgi:hypothetical protein
MRVIIPQSISGSIARYDVCAKQLSAHGAAKPAFTSTQIKH